MHSVLTTVQVPRPVCTEDCSADIQSIYNPSDTKYQLRWCGECVMWFHSSCLGEQVTEFKPDDSSSQSYLASTGESLLHDLLRQPIARVSRKHAAPLSLERAQKIAVERWVEFQEGNEVDEGTISGVFEESGVFADGMPDDWVKIVEQALVDLGSPIWYKCPLCPMYI